MNKDLRVLDRNILIIPDIRETTSSGIIIPESSQKQQVIQSGFISVVGPNVTNKEDLVEGAYVIIKRHTGKWVPFEGYKYILIDERDILAVDTSVKMTNKESENTNGN